MITEGYRFPIDPDDVDVAALKKVANDVEKASTLARDLALDGRIWGALRNVKVTDFLDQKNDSVTAWFLSKPSKRKPHVGLVVGFSPTRSIDDMLAFCAAMTDDETAMGILHAVASRHLDGPMETFPCRLFDGVMAAVVDRFENGLVASPTP